jgi:hypothetical protein
MTTPKPKTKPWRESHIRFWNAALHIEPWIERTLPYCPFGWSIETTYQVSCYGFGSTLGEFRELVQSVTYALDRPPSSVSGKLDELRSPAEADAYATWTDVEVPHRCSWKGTALKVTIRISAWRMKGCKIIEEIETREVPPSETPQTIEIKHRKLHPECQHLLDTLEDLP